MQIDRVATLGECMFRRSRMSLAVIAVFCGGSIPLGASAQITLDGTVGPGVARALTPNMNGNFQIPAADGTQLRGNLFHSFGAFNVQTGQSATFNGPGSVNNIIGRVTGGSLSNIDGLVRSTIQGANLFLVNPAGILFGPN
ncbi:MAG TPA: filamentous hemagglutinin N-terminal domain-containing protein, partial [Burkholderiales bacterium]|nr:filamentous hemagglutinin N-terminal domain-containing protein [Burkholderiales bacterium]